MIESTGQLSTRVGVLRDLGLTARLLLLFPALAVMSVAAEVVCLDLLYYQDPDAQDPSFTARTLSSIGLLAWNAVLPAAIVALLVLTARCWPRGIPVAVGICMLLSCAVVTLLVSMMAGPDAFDGLVLLLLPSRCFQTGCARPVRTHRTGSAKSTILVCHRRWAAQEVAAVARDRTSARAPPPGSLRIRPGEGRQWYP